MLFFFVWMIGLLGALLLSVGGVTFLVISVVDRRLGSVGVPLGMLCGYAADALRGSGGRVGWRLACRRSGGRLAFRGHRFGART